MEIRFAVRRMTAGPARITSCCVRFRRFFVPERFLLALISSYRSKAIRDQCRASQAMCCRSDSLIPDSPDEC